jgi:hypothetical protein
MELSSCPLSILFYFLSLFLLFPSSFQRLPVIDFSALVKDFNKWNWVAISHARNIALLSLLSPTRTVWLNYQARSKNLCKDVSGKKNILKLYTLVRNRSENFSWGHRESIISFVDLLKFCKYWYFLICKKTVFSRFALNFVSNFEYRAALLLFLKVK